MEKPVAFLGLGNMGTAMARNLLKGKIPLFIYNRSADKCAALLKEGAQQLHIPSEAFQKSNIAITMVANDKVLEEISEELLKSIKPGDIHISMSSVSPETSTRLAKKHAEKKAHLIAAPVFGRPEAAAAAKLLICTAGDAAAKKQILPLLQLLGKKVEDFGDDVGNASLVKLCGNFMIASAIESMGEAYALLKNNGIDPEIAAAFYGEHLFQSPIYQNYGKLVSTENVKSGAFKLTLGLKDVNLARKTAAASHVKTPVADLLSDLMTKGVDKGRGDWDWTSVILTAKDS